MAGQAGREQRALRNIEGGKQRGGAMALVIMGHRAAPAVLQREAGLSAIERLDLAFLIHRQNDRMFWRMQIQSHHILQFLLEVWILTELESVDPMWAKAMGGPDPMDKRGIRP